ncbi:MAG TPA: hypothetical protein H9801_03020 [Candidatus Collinsella stercoripullorum]|nr:hypothetical protein [Candidatus Collinsella stercoripullorum]
MDSTEDIETRLEMRDMHEFFLDKIRGAINQSNYFEAAWLEYACLENRYYRVLGKYKKNCKYCKGKCKSNKNELALRTKIRCVQRLLDADIECVSMSFSQEMITNTLSWVKKRNNLMHSLLAIETYQDSFDHAFEELANEGGELVVQTYNACTRFRAIYYQDDYVFSFPEECMERCACNTQSKEGSAKR